MNFQLCKYLSSTQIALGKRRQRLRRLRRDEANCRRQCVKSCAAAQNATPDARIQSDLLYIAQSTRAAAVAVDVSLAIERI